MQSLDIISVNVWQILISLANLLLLFLIVKHFLYRPVKNLLAKRRQELDDTYRAAEETTQEALSLKSEWEAKMETADAQADLTLKQAGERAARKEERLTAEASAKAAAIVERAREEADRERAMAREDIRRAIVEISTQMTEKILEREVRTEDHRAWMDSFLSEVTNGDDGNE